MSQVRARRFGEIGFDFICDYVARTNLQNNFASLRRTGRETSGMKCRLSIVYTALGRQADDDVLIKKTWVGRFGRDVSVVHKTDQGPAPR